MSRNIIFIAIAVIFYLGLTWSYGKRDVTVSDMTSKIYSWLAIALALGLILGTPYCGKKIPGSFFERDNYQGMFYVNLFPNGLTVKSYCAPALIQATIESDIDYHTETYRVLYSWREYKIDYATIPHMGKITFYNADQHLELNKIALLFDDNDQYWGIELTERPVK
jgi:hypothetical protein